uniref:F5/8 type C domain-containing protein n=1 Tax=viral metagenome TaxID=1070528 RepID=A0A6C0IIL6_9ZZZZ
MTQPALKIVPLPDKRKFETNISTISGLKQSGTYLPNGNYELSCSSRANIQHDAYHTFNNNKQYWESDYRGNPTYNTLNSSYPEYVQSAFTGNYPSAYRGGGRKENTFITKLGAETNVNDIKGEWVQVKIPYNVYLNSYIIEVPPSSKSNKFPNEFIVAGSTNGQDWEAIHTKTMSPDFKGTKENFEFTYPKKFSYFRLIITKMQGPIDRVQLTNWSLFGNTVLTSKKEDDKEAFVSLGRCLDCKPNSKPSASPDYAPYVEGFDNYTYSSELRQKYQLPNSEEENAKKTQQYNKYVKAVEEKQIDPLQKKAIKYEDDVDQITSEHTNITDVLHSITNSTQTGLLDEIKKHPSYTNKSTIHKIDNVEEARLKDVEKMINTNNEIFVLGGIATATLLVFGGMLLTKQ